MFTEGFEKIAEDKFPKIRSALKSLAQRAKTKAALAPKNLPKPTTHIPPTSFQETLAKIHMGIYNKNKTGKN